MICDPFLRILGGWALGGLFLAAAAHKLTGPMKFRGVLQEFRLLPDALIAPAVLVIPAVELTIGVLLMALAIEPSPMPLSLAALLLLGYAVVLAISIGRGNIHIDCGCLGFAANRPRLSWAMVVRNALMALLAIVLARLPSAERPLVWLDWVDLVAGLAAFALVYASLDHIITLANSESAA